MRRLFFATSLLVGCAHAPDRAPIAPTDPASLAARGPAPLVWSKVRNDARFDYATVDVSVAGYTVPLVVDTGTNTHMLVTGLAWYLGLGRQVRETVNVQGAHGEGVDVEIVGDVPFRLLRWPPNAPASFLVADLPVRSRLMGFFSPQAFVGDGAAVVDFRRGTMESAPRSALDAAAALPGAVRATPECRANGIALFTVDVNVDGHRVPLTVDTGSGSTSVFAETEVGRALAGRARRARQYSVALDGEEETSTVPDARLVVAGLATGVALTMIGRAPPKFCSETANVPRRSAGALGIDVLRRCVVVIAKSDAVLRCGAD